MPLNPENHRLPYLTVKDRGVAWTTSSGDGEAAGIAQRPNVDTGDSCGYLTVETNWEAMRVTRVLGGKIIPVATCHHETSLG